MSHPTVAYVRRTLAVPARAGKKLDGSPAFCKTGWGEMIEDIRSKLWNADVGPDSYQGSSEQYQAAILEQYRLYVLMADRISARRALANTFFLTLNTAVF